VGRPLSARLKSRVPLIWLVGKIGQFTASRASKLIPGRRRDSHKGQNGRVLVIGGSAEYFGSPALAGLAALRAGADLCTIVAPRFITPTIAGYSPDLLVHSYRGDYLGSAEISRVLGMESRVDALVIGNGLTKRPRVLRAVRSILSEWRKPVVIDADAIQPGVSLASAHALFTPHVVEFRRLGGGTPSPDVAGRAQQVAALACALHAVVLLKGVTNISSDGEKTFASSTGNAGMTAGGTGDTLAGIAGAFLAQGLSPLDAASLAAFVNGRAGALALKKFGYSLLASDLVSEIPAALQALRVPP